MSKHTRIRTQAQLDKVLQRKSRLPRPIFVDTDTVLTAHCTYDQRAQLRVGGRSRLHVTGAGIVIDAYDESHVTLRGDIHASVSDHASATLYDGRVYRYDEATVDRKSFFARAYSVSGSASWSSPETWALTVGALVQDNEVYLYKALPNNLTSGVEYGKPIVWDKPEVTCDDFTPDLRCGGGLHLAPCVRDALAFRWSTDVVLECTAPLSTVIPLEGDTAKVKVPSVRVLRRVPREDWKY